MTPKDPHGDPHAPPDDEADEPKWSSGASMGADGRLVGSLPPPKPSNLPEPPPARPAPAPGGLPSIVDAAHIELGRETRSLQPTGFEGDESTGRSRLRPIAFGAALLILVGAVALGIGPLEKRLAAAPTPTPGGIPLVTVDSDPSEADVYSGGEKLGTTPLVFPNDYAAGSILTLRIQKRGYEPSEVSFAGTHAAHLRATLKHSR